MHYLSNKKNAYREKLIAVEASGKSRGGKKNGGHDGKGGKGAKKQDPGGGLRVELTNCGHSSTGADGMACPDVGAGINTQAVQPCEPTGRPPVGTLISQEV